MRKAWVAGIAVLLGAAVNARADEWSHQYSLKGRPELHVTTDDGSVRIETGERLQIDARVTTRGWRIGPDQVTVTESQTGDRVEIEVRVPHDHWGLDFGHRSITVTLQVPRDVDLDVRTGDGSVSVQPVSGRLRIFTGDGRAPHFPSASDRFPDRQTNVVPIHVSMGTYNAMQQSDAHSYWEFNYLGTNWVHPLYELPFTGGFPDQSAGQAPDAFQDGEIGKLQSIVPGSGPAGIQNDPRVFGDNPNLPRDPDKFDGDDDKQREFRFRNIPSGLANEIYLDVYERLASFEPRVKNLQKRLFDAYAAEVARVDSNGDGVISAVEGDIDTSSDGFPDNTRLFLPPTAFNRFAVTREINDGLLAPRFAPSQRAWVLSGFRVPVDPAVSASAGRDGDDR